VGAGFHAGHGDLLADGPRHEEEGDVQVERLQQRQRRGHAEMRDGVVAKDDVPCLAAQGGLRGCGRVHALADRGVAVALQLVAEEQGLVLDILDDQHAEGRGHGCPRVGGGPAFNSSQYIPSWRAASMNWAMFTGFCT
jgi:hypothetical protein